MNNLLVNGDFATGELAPWTTTAEGAWVIKPDGAGKYIQLSKAGDLSQTTPDGSYKPTSLTFEVRAGEAVNPGDSVIFSYGLSIEASGGVESFGDLSLAAKEWQSVTFKIHRKPTPATRVTVQVHTASDPEKLGAKPGNVHFRNFQLT